MKSGNKILSSIGCFLLLAGLLGILINACCFDHGYYRRQYEKNDAVEMTGMGQEDLIKSTDTLLDYLQNKRDDIEVYAVVNGMMREVFSTQEKLHMQDVKHLYQGFLLVTGVCLSAGVLLLVASLQKHKGQRRKILQSGFVQGAGMLLILIGFLAVWAIADFNAFWTSFHRFFFPNNTYWAMDPNVSIMINMFPGDFWFDLVVKIILLYLLCLILLWLILFQPWNHKEAAHAQYRSL